jgi:carbonic anhydrase
MRINLKSVKLPTYQLTLETGIDKIAEKLGVQDLDFESHPKFSRNFLLQGEDEAAVRAFFTPELLQLHETNPDIFGECVGGALLFRLGRNLANEDGVERLLAFGRSFCELALQSQSIIAK